MQQSNPLQLAEYDTDRETMMDKLESFKGAADDQQSSQWQITQKEEELAALQKAISDLQVCLFQEREQVRDQEPTGPSKQPIRTHCLGNLTGYQPIRDQYQV